MTEAADRAIVEPVDGSGPRDAQEGAWYLYGVVRAPSRAPGADGRSGETGTEAANGSLTVAGTPVRLLEHRELAAVVRPVSRQDFTEDSLQARLRDPAALEALARDHNAVIAEIHREQAILPAKFGSVYASLDDLRTALDQEYDRLSSQLKRVRGCDEWAVHVYADRSIVERHVATDHASIRQLREELAAARPGRAFFLQRKLDTALTAAIDQTLIELARAAYDQLAALALAAQATPSTHRGRGGKGEIEILKASFLVPRPDTEAFIHAVDSFAAEHQGVRSEYSGPWPPYSFAAQERS